ncbi:MAG: hypothetical protein ACTSPQ_22270 [Candidatus Helarchaeota archaeon]
MRALSTDVQDLVYKQVRLEIERLDIPVVEEDLGERLEIERLDIPVVEEDLGEIVSDILKTAYEFKY